MQGLAAYVSRKRSTTMAQFQKCTRTRDLIDAELSANDFVEDESHCPYVVGDRVMLQRPDRHQKRLAPFERDWTVKAIVSSMTKVIEKPSLDNRRVSEKVVNIALLKKDRPNSADVAATEASICNDD